MKKFSTKKGVVFHIAEFSKTKNWHGQKFGGGKALKKFLYMYCVTIENIFTWRENVENLVENSNASRGLVEN